MFGQNPIRKQRLGSGNSLDIVNIFPTIQGEGPFAGETAIFIRLAGCNLQCHFCDTDFETGTQTVPIDELIQAIADLQMTEIKTDLIVFTGGEPMLQNLIPIIKLLIPTFRVQIETAGTVWLPGLEEIINNREDSGVTIVCSPKTGSVNKLIQQYCNDWKYITREGDESPDDGLPLLSTQVKRKFCKIARPQFVAPRIYLQPCDEQDEELNQLNLETTVKLAKQYGYRVCLQQHKYMGVE